MRYGTDTYHTLKEIIQKKYGELTVLKGQAYSGQVSACLTVQFGNAGGRRVILSAWNWPWPASSAYTAHLDLKPQCCLGLVCLYATLLLQV